MEKGRELSRKAYYILSSISFLISLFFLYLIWKGLVPQNFFIIGLAFLGTIAFGFFYFGGAMLIPDRKQEQKDEEK